MVRVHQPSDLIFSLLEEKRILSNLYDYLDNKTAIIITHRIFSLFNFDKIIVLHEGKIIEQGTHDQLLEQNGIYTEMYLKQQKNEGDDPQVYNTV